MEKIVASFIKSQLLWNNIGLSLYDYTFLMRPSISDRPLLDLGGLPIFSASCFSPYKTIKTRSALCYLIFGKWQQF